MNVSPSIPSHKEPPSLNEDEDANPTRLDFPSTPPGVLPSIRLPFHIVEPVSPLLFAPTQQGMFVSFKDITYDVPNRANKKESLCILDGISGCFEPGKMTCLMGPSGSGKSTLLDVLSGRKTQGSLGGAITFGGEVPTKEFLRRYTGYVEQFDTLIPTLTVYEMLLYTAELKTPTSVSHADKVLKVEQVIEKLRLQDCRNTVIGDVLNRGISGGQAKRTNIGLALVAEPRVLFLDEPTSGLDSFTAHEVMMAIREVASSGITVIATIHSPSVATFNAFDSLLMLLNGKQVYFGRQGGTAITHFESVVSGIKNFPPLGKGESPAEWVVDMTTESSGNPEEVEKFAEAYRTSTVKADAFERHERLIKQYNLKRSASTHALASDDIAEHAGLAIKASATRESTTVSIFWALWVFARYRIWKNIRNPQFLGQRLGDKVLVGFIVATLYWGKGNDMSNSANQFAIAAVLFMWSTFPAFGAAAYVPAITLERALYYRERADGLYTPLAYLLFKIIEEIIIVVPSSLVVAVCIFNAVGLVGSFGLFWGVYLVSLMFGIVLAYFVAAIAPNVDVANAIVPAYISTLLFFNGFLIRYEDIPAAWYWYSVINPLRYNWTALMINQFGNVSDSTPYMPGQTMLQYFWLDNRSAAANVGYLSIFLGVFFILAYLAIRYVSHQNR